MDLDTLPAISTLKSEGLAQGWDFNGRSGHRLLPKMAGQAAQLLNWAQESGLRVAFHPQEAALLEEPLWLDHADLKQVRQYPVDDFIIEVETGMPFGQLVALLSKNWQAFPLTYPDELTLGEILANDLPALESGLRGYPRDYVLKTELVTPDGQITISGADVVKNVTGYDLAKLYVGGRHTFGLLTSVTLKLAALPQCRRYWRFPADSFHLAFALSEKLLASNLPLQLCEIYREEGHWAVLIEIAGDDWVAVDCLQTLNTLAARPPQALDEPAGKGLAARLQQWPENHTVLEASLSLSNWSEFARALMKQSALDNMRFQIRPAAGLVMLSAPFFPFSALPYLKAEVARHQGFLQILRISPTDVATFSEALALYEEFNLPEDPATRRLLKELKKGYDPSGVLFTPRLPL